MKKSRTDITSAIPNGVPRMMPYIVTGTTVLTFMYFSLEYAFRESSSILGLPRAGDEFCKKYTDDKSDQVVCSRSDLFAFQVSSCLALVCCATLGIYTWYVTGRSHTAVPQTPEGRLFGYIPEAELIAAICFTFQIWDFMISLLIEEHRTPIMLSHHFMAASVSWCSIRYQCLQHYGVFFLGLSEVSSVFLVVVDLSKYFPPIPGSLFDQIVGTVVAPLFAISFIVYRVVYWWPISIQLFRDCYNVIQSGQASKLRPGKEWVLYVFLAMNLPLGLLQLYWASIVLDEAQKVVLTLV